jgi:hypothetical protein
VPTVQQFLARYPQPVPDSEHERVQAALEDAETAVRVEAGLSDDAPLPAALEPIVLRVAIRTFANPLGRFRRKPSGTTRGVRMVVRSAPCCLRTSARRSRV